MLLLFGTVCLSVFAQCQCSFESLTTPPHHKDIPQDVMVGIVNRLGLKLLAIHNQNNENNIAISPYGTLAVLIAIQEGVRGSAADEIFFAANIPPNPSLIRIGLRDIHRHLKSYFIPKEGFLAGLTLNQGNISLTCGYKEILNFYGFDIEAFNKDFYDEFYNSQGNDSIVLNKGGDENKGSTEMNTENTTGMGSTFSPSNETETEPAMISPNEMESSTDFSTSNPIENETVAGETVTTVSPEGEGPSTQSKATETNTDGKDSSTEAIPMESNNGTNEEGSSTEAVTTESTDKEDSPTEAVTTESKNGTIVEGSPNEAVTIESESGTDEEGSSTEAVSTESKTDETATENPKTETEETTTEGKEPAETTLIDEPTTEAAVKENGGEITEAATEVTNTEGANDGTTMADATESSTQETEKAENTETPPAKKRSARSIEDYIIAQYYDSLAVTHRPSPGSYFFTQQFPRFHPIAPPGPPPSFPLYSDIHPLNRNEPLSPSSEEETDDNSSNFDYEVNMDYLSYDAVLPYFKSSTLSAQILRFPLDNPNYYLLLVLPTADDIDHMIKDLASYDSLSNLVKNLRDTRVKALIPSFSLKGIVVLTPTLQKLGIRGVFEPNGADFSKMTVEPGIYITNIEQVIQVNIKNFMDEIMEKNKDKKRNLQQYDTVEFTADHPFLYFVMDSELNVCLMAGKIVNPLNSRIS